MLLIAATSTDKNQWMLQAWETLQRDNSKPQDICIEYYISHTMMSISLLVYMPIPIYHDTYTHTYTPWGQPWLSWGPLWRWWRDCQTWRTHCPLTRGGSQWQQTQPGWPAGNSHPYLLGQLHNWKMKAIILYINYIVTLSQYVVYAGKLH